jgi:hypothetical protein
MSSTELPAVAGPVQRGVRPFAWALTHRDGRVTLHQAAEHATAYRDTCIAETPLYAMPTEFAEFEVTDSDGLPQAICSGPRAQAFQEALHCAQQYEKDGPVTMCEVLRVPIGRLPANVGANLRVACGPSS